MKNVVMHHYCFSVCLLIGLKCRSQLQWFVGEVHICLKAQGCVSNWHHVRVNHLVLQSSSTAVHTSTFPALLLIVITSLPRYVAVWMWITRCDDSLCNNFLNDCDIVFIDNFCPPQIHQCITDRRRWWQTCATRQRYPAWWTLALQTAR